MIINLVSGLLKSLFNHKGHKVGIEYTKLKTYTAVLCDLCVISL
jgi:hypothetical protein